MTSTTATSNMITPDTPLGGAVYPFLRRLNRRWALLARTVGKEDKPRKRQPTLRWVNGDSIHDLYVLHARGANERFDAHLAGFAIAQSPGDTWMILMPRHRCTAVVQNQDCAIAPIVNDVNQGS